MESGAGGRGGGGGEGGDVNYWNILICGKYAFGAFSYALTKWTWVFWAWIKWARKFFPKIGKLFSPQI